LRALPLRPRRALLRLLHSRAVRVLTAPATAILLDVGGLYLLYLTGLYARTENNDLIHAGVHLHMFLAGCLLSWAIIGIDPIRRRPSITARIVTLVVAGAAHDTLSKLMYAHDLPATAGSISDRHTGAELMYYGGTVIDLALAPRSPASHPRSRGENRRHARASVEANDRWERACASDCTSRTSPGRAAPRGWPRTSPGLRFPRRISALRGSA
jgi:putative membrane protein